MKQCIALMAGLAAALGVTSCSQKTEPPEAPPFMQAPSAAVTGAGDGTVAAPEPVPNSAASARAAGQIR